MNTGKTLFHRNWPIIVGLITFILLAAWLDAHDRPACLVKAREKTHVAFQRKTLKQYSLIEARTSEQ